MHFEKSVLPAVCFNIESVRFDEKCIKRCCGVKERRYFACGRDERDGTQGNGISRRGTDKDTAENIRLTPPGDVLILLRRSCGERVNLKFANCSRALSGGLEIVARCMARRGRNFPVKWPNTSSVVNCWFDTLENALAADVHSRYARARSQHVNNCNRIPEKGRSSKQSDKKRTFQIRHRTPELHRNTSQSLKARPSEKVPKNTS